MDIFLKLRWGQLARRQYRETKLWKVKLCIIWSHHQKSKQKFKLLFEKKFNSLVLKIISDITFGGNLFDF